MKPFVVNRYGRIVFPFNFFPALDFSVFQTLDQFAAVIKRDFEDKATVSEILSNPQNLTYHLLAHDADYPGYGYDDIIEYAHPVPELEALMRQAMVLHNQYRWDRSKTRVIEVGKLHDDDFVVVFYPRNYEVLQFIRRVKGGRRARPRRPAPLPAQAPVSAYPPIDVRQRFRVMPRIEALAVYKGELTCTNDDLIRNGAYCWSPMTAKEIDEKTGIVERLYADLDLDHLALHVPAP